MKKKLSRLLCALLVMTMVLAMVPAVSAATYDGFDDTAKTASGTLGGTVTLSFPCSKSSSHAEHHGYSCDGDYFELNKKDNSTVKLDVKKVNSSKTDGAITKTVVTYCNACAKKYTYTVSLSYAAVSTFALDADNTTGITFSGKSSPYTGALAEGASATIKLKVADKSGNTDTVNNDVYWRSSNSSYVTVTKNTKDPTSATIVAGAKASGKTVDITATSVANNSKSITFTVTVSDNSLTLELKKTQLNLDVNESTNVSYTIGGPAYDKNCFVQWKLLKNKPTDTSKRFDELKLTETDVAELSGDAKGTFTTKKNGEFYLCAQAYTVDENSYSDIQVCRVYVTDGSYDVEIVPSIAEAIKGTYSESDSTNKGSAAGVYDPEDEDAKFYTAEKYQYKDRLTLTSKLMSDEMTAVSLINATWTVADSDVVAFENYDSSIRTKTVKTVEDVSKVTIRAMGTGKTTVTAKTDEGTAKFTVEVWDKTMILAPSSTVYDYTSEITVSSENPIASMQAKKPTHPVTEWTAEGTQIIPVPVEWTGRSIDEKNSVVTFTGELKLLKNENYSEYVVVNNSGTPVKNPNVTVRASAKISDSASSIKITTQPKSATYNVGKTIESLKVVATGSSTLNYQWYEGGKAISGATKATYSPSISKSGTYQYYCIISGGGDFVVSDTATIKVSGDYRVTLTNSSDKEVSAPSVNVGSSVTYSVDIEQWDYSAGKYYNASGSYSISWNVTGNSELGSVSATSSGSSVTFTGALAKASSKSYSTMTVTASIKKNGSSVGEDEVTVQVLPAEASTVKQSVGTGAALKASSITSAISKASGSSKTSYIIFNTPKNCKLTKSSSSSTVVDDAKCYVSASSGQKLSDIYVKTTSTSASVTYTAYDANDYILATGTVSFDADDSSDTLYASGASFKFSGAVDQIMGEYPDASYVKFELPNASEGTLYFDYDTIASYQREVKESEKYYIDAGSSQDDVEDVYFLPVYGVKGTVEIDYTAYSSSNSDLGDGTITLTIKEKTASSKFTDVTYNNTGYWAAGSIDFMSDNGLFNGTSTYKFSPNDSMTRAMLVTVLYRAAGEPSVSGVTNPFTDVASKDYYYNAVLWAYKNSVVTGTSANKFSPDANVTREQIATILYRYMGSPTATGSLVGYTDRTKISSYAATAMQWAIGKGYITGTTATTLDPTGNATRAQVAVMMHRFLTK